ncbi:hypothetical protein, partial [Desulfuromonas acetoxidans]|uniref:hypothetical protein n=1 Tax=Desulfuromonas acetoxidans TaxID=891 RepID=UPI001EE3918F
RPGFPHVPAGKISIKQIDRGYSLTSQSFFDRGKRNLLTNFSLVPRPSVLCRAILWRGGTLLYETAKPGGNNQRY